MHSITLYRNADDKHKFEIFEAGLNSNKGPKRIKKTKFHACSAGSFKELKKNYKSDNKSPTRQLSRFLNNSDFVYIEGGHFFSCSYESHKKTKDGHTVMENILIHVTENWDRATVRIRTGRETVNKCFALVLSNKIGKYSNSDSFIYNIFFKDEIPEEVFDVDNLLSKLINESKDSLMDIIAAQNEALAAKDKLIESLRVNNDALSRRNEKLEERNKLTRGNSRCKITQDLGDWIFEQDNEHEKESIENASTENEAVETQTIKLVEAEEPIEVVEVEEIQETKQILEITSSEMFKLKIDNPIKWSILQGKINSGEINLVRT